jgi:hypothetical protein
MLRSVYLRKIQHTALVLFTGASLVLAGCGGDDPAPAKNHAPEVVANASAAEVKVGTVVQLDASQTSDADKDPLTFAWTLKAPAGSKAAIAKPGDAKTSFTPDVEGTYSLTIDVSDGKDGKGQQTISIKAVAASQNARPKADATPSGTDVDLDTSVTFDGKNSSDPDPGDTITFAWTITKKPAASKAAISTSTAIAPTATLDVAGDYEVQLIVTDNHGAASDPLTIAVKAHEKTPDNHKPVAVAEAPALAVKVGQDVTVDGSKSSDPDPGDKITYAWTFTKVPAASAAKFADASLAKTTFTADKEGEYIAQLIVTDSRGAASDSKTVTIEATPAAVNHAPTAKAETSATEVRPSKSVTLDGSHSTDPDAGDKLTYAWTIAAAPAQSKAAISPADATKASFAFTPDLEGPYKLELVVTDSAGAKSAPSAVVINASNAVNLAPIANIAKPPSDVEINATLTLDGSGSKDPDGDKFTYAWTIVSAPHGSTATLAGATDPKASIVPDLHGNFVISLVVTDDHGKASAPVTVIVNAVTADGTPTAHASASPSDVETSKLVTLDATGSTDPENDPLSYAWTIVSTPKGSTVALSDPHAPKPTFTADLDGTYVFGLVANDGKKSSLEDRVTVTATKLAPPPIANVVASSTQIRLGGSVTLDGSSSVDPDGQKLTYAWSIVAAPIGSAASLSAGDGAKVTFQPDKKGYYVIELVVNDGKKSSVAAHATIQVKEANPAPTAVASISRNAIELGQTVTLDGASSSDPEMEPLTFAWVVESRPDASAAKIANADASRATFVADAIGQYVFTLTVTDPVGNTSSAKVSVNVGTFDQDPTAIASAPKEAQLGAPVTLDGASSRDPENAPLTYTWAINSAPAGSQAALSSTSDAKPTFTPDKLGYYVFTLTVSDGKKTSLPVQVTIHGVQENLGPVVQAKVSDNEIEAGNKITLDSSGTYDPENDAITRTWTIVSKPAGSAAAISDATAEKPTVTLDKLGRYEFRLAVSDGATTTTSSSIYAEAVAVNAAPTAAASGPTAPVAIGASVTLDGSGSHDPENAVVTYEWTVIAVPQSSAAKLSDAAAKAPTFTADVAGDYVFQLIVSDGQKKSEAVTVTVKAQ